MCNTHLKQVRKEGASTKNTTQCFQIVVHDAYTHASAKGGARGVRERVRVRANAARGWSKRRSEKLHAGFKCCLCTTLASLPLHLASGAQHQGSELRLAEKPITRHVTQRDDIWIWIIIFRIPMNAYGVLSTCEISSVTSYTPMDG
jgi:hypothetical protein